jgi:phage gp29-like protein
MAQNSRIGRKTSMNLSSKVMSSSDLKYGSTIVKNAVSNTRQDISGWKRAESLAQKTELPKWHLLQALFDDIEKDALLTSQYKNRLLKSLSERIVLKKPNGDVDEEQTEMINNSVFAKEINRHILDANFRRVSLMELNINAEGVLEVELIPRKNIDPEGGFLYPDYTEDKKVNYRELPEFGTWLLEFGEKGTLGLLNAAVPHVLFKKFAQSCYSELCEIFGIPPRVLKTNTHNPASMQRGKKMMREMGAAAWMIIDENESFDFAKGSTTNGDVYTNLINLCNNEISMLISGAIIGQDTKNGSRSKDESSQTMLQVLIDNDLRTLEMHWNTTVIPALQRIGVLKGDLIYGYEPTEDKSQLWKITQGLLPFKQIDDEWIKDKFGVEVTGDKAPSDPNAAQKLGADFFA